MQGICIHTTGQYLAGSRRNRIVCTCQSGDRVEEDYHIVTAFYHAFRFFQYDTCNLYVTFCRFVKCRSDHFGIYAARHICHFFGTFVNKQHDHVRFRMVGCDCVSDVFHQDRLTGFGLRHNQSTLSFTDR